MLRTARPDFVRAGPSDRPRGVQRRALRVQLALPPRDARRPRAAARPAAVRGLRARRAGRAASPVRQVRAARAGRVPAVQSDQLLGVED